MHRRLRNVVEIMLARRDPNVSYRIGTRRHAWPETSRAEGSAGIVEQLRNYELVDLDELLRKKEHGTDLFRPFAEDVFRRRLKAADYKVNQGEESYLRLVFGNGETAEEKAKRYAGAGETGPVKIEDDWPEKAREVLSELSKSKPLSAKLGEAWVRQQMRPSRTLVRVLPSKGSLPWEATEKQWWKKERIAQALLQIAASKQQRMMWGGDLDVLGLSYGHILIFLSLCNHIWASWLRRKNGDAAIERGIVPQIHDVREQDAGIQLASKYWYQKIRTDPGGDSRRRLVSFLGRMFREKLRSDLTMSYPGSNGFTVPIAELERDPDVARVLNEGAAFGFLVDRRHTPRSKNRGESLKWYLHPILCPYFDIPYQHTKEPMEVHVSEIRRWFEINGIAGFAPPDTNSASGNVPRQASDQLALPFDGDSGAD